MIRLSKMADYAVVILVALQQKKGALASASGLSMNTGLPEPTVAKVLKLLAKAGLADSIRGAQGGYRLNKEAEEIAVLEIIRAVDGPVSLAACVEGSEDSCDYSECCPVKGRWDVVNVAVKTALSSISLADMIAPARHDFMNNYQEERA